MATSKSTRKPSTTRAASSTSTSTSDADTTPDPAETTEATSSASTQPAGEQAGDDPAAALKKKIRTTQQITDPKPDDLTDEQRLNLVGAPAGALPGPRTLTSPTAPVRKGEEYVTAESDGHVAFIPERSKQPATVRVWIEGQRVRKDMHDALSGIVASTAKEAPVLEGDAYVKVAPYL